MKLRFIKRLPWGYLFFGVPTFALLSYAFYFYLTLPNAQVIKGCLTTEMFQVQLCPGSNKYVKLSEISPFLKQAILISEDAGFYGHDGFDRDEIKASFEKNLSRGGFVRGGSTITQQLAKNVFLSKEKTIPRKLREAILTYQIEKILTKDQIYERYLNVVQFGKNIFGVKEAAHHYFKKSPRELSILEASFLALLLPNPEKYSTSFYKKNLSKFVQKRIKEICAKLLSVGRIGSDEYQAAMSQLAAFPFENPEPEKGLGDSDGGAAAGEGSSDPSDSESDPLEWEEQN